MADGDGQSDSERHGPSQVTPLTVHTRKHHEHQHEADHELDPKALSDAHSIVIRDAHRALWGIIGRQSFQNSRPSQSPKRLRHHVKKTSYNGHTACCDEPHGNCWVYMPSADMTYGPDDGGHGESKGKGDLDDVTAITCPASD